MAGLPIAQIIPWTVVGLLLTALIVIVARSRKPSSFVDEAVLEALYHMSKATPDLREGFDQNSADRVTSQLLELLKCVAIGITDAEGTLVSWDGEANDHYVDLTAATYLAIRKHRREVVQHDDVPCDHRGTCKMRTAVIVPLIVEGEIEAALIVVGRTRGKRRSPVAAAGARCV